MLSWVPHAVDAPAIDVREDGPERLVVGVDIADDRGWHWLRFRLRALGGADARLPGAVMLGNARGPSNAPGGPSEGLT